MDCAQHLTSVYQDSIAPLAGQTLYFRPSTVQLLDYTSHLNQLAVRLTNPY